jgi:hypothetical protein
MSGMTADLDILFYVQARPYHDRFETAHYILRSDPTLIEKLREVCN